MKHTLKAHTPFTTKQFAPGFAIVKFARAFNSEVLLSVGDLNCSSRGTNDVSHSQTSYCQLFVFQSDIRCSVSYLRRYFTILGFRLIFSVKPFIFGMSRSRATQQQPGTYSPEQQHALVAAANRAVTSQLFAAADLMSRVFQVNAVPYAFMGGFALKLRGSIRDTQDVDVAVGCTMQRAIDVLSVQVR